MLNLNVLEQITNKFKQLPGISKKQSEKIALFLMQNRNFFKDFYNDLPLLEKKIINCSQCNIICDDKLCSICQNENRENKLMIVENTSDVIKFETLGLYSGYYFSIDHIIDDITELQANMKLWDKLLEVSLNKNEIIFALSPTLSGEIMTNYLLNIVKVQNKKITQLANGIPVGSKIDYIDELSLKQSLINRKEK